VAQVNRFCVNREIADSRPPKGQYVSILVLVQPMAKQNPVIAAAVNTVI
jgi:hypothetical protein